MKRLSKKEIEKVTNNVGEVDCLRWNEILFTWDHAVSDGVDEYLADGPFIFKYDPHKVYDQFIIKADWVNKVFFLKTGRGKILHWVNLLGV